MSESMFASRLHRIRNDLKLDHIPVPDTASREVLIDVKAAGICHSDINYRDGIAPVQKLPITLGHEIAGTVAKVGSKVTGFRDGDRVLVHYVLSCGRCFYCRKGQENYCVQYRMIGKDVDGGFAEYVRVPARSVIRLPKDLAFEQAAIMGCAVPTAYRALKRARVQPGDTVIVFGVGGLGMHAVQLAAMIFRAKRTIAVDVNDWKLNRAKYFGATETVNAADQDVVGAIRRITDGKLGDVVLDFVGHDTTIRTSIDSTGKGGRMVLVGIGTKSFQVSPYRSLIGREMEIIGVDDHLKTELLQLIKLVRSRRLDLSHSVTHRVPLDDVNRGLGILEAKQENAIRVVAAK